VKSFDLFVAYIGEGQGQILTLSFHIMLSSVRPSGDNRVLRLCNLIGRSAQSNTSWRYGGGNVRSDSLGET
jgi:hypothetical protein